MIILGYGFTLLSYLLYCISRFLHNKKNMLLLDLAAQTCTMIALYSLGSMSGAFTFMVIFLTLIAANLKVRLNKRWTLLYICFQLLYLLILIFTYKGISSILVFTTASISTFFNWWLSPQKIRFLGGCNSILFLIYQITIKNWAGLLETIVMFSNFTAYIKYRHQKQRPTKIKDHQTHSRKRKSS